MKAAGEGENEIGVAFEAAEVRHWPIIAHSARS
jgi:hypothetical protein